MVRKVGKYYVCEVCGLYRDEDESKVKKHESMHVEIEPIVAFKEELKEMFGEMFSKVKTLSDDLEKVKSRISELEKTVSELSRAAE